MNKVFIDLHVLQSVPPSCLNRDDTGSPKSAIYGGVRRARVSSQAWKRVMRLKFKEYLSEAELGCRTLRVYDLIAKEICRQREDVSLEDAMGMAKAVLDKGKVQASKKKGDEDKLGALFFIGLQQVKNLAALALGDAEVTEKDVVEALKKNNAVEVALFGRMVADNPKLNCDACAQVAHAISTHQVENEYDFFTAVDDNEEENKGNAGAGHMGTVEYHSATLYRYATVAVHNLYEELGCNGDALAKAIREFTRAFVYSMPTGKQNTFAANTIPDAVLAVVRTDRPLSLASAFEVPVRGEGFLPASAKALETYAQNAYEKFCGAPVASYVTDNYNYLSTLGEQMPLPQLVDALGADAERMVLAHE